MAAGIGEAASVIGILSLAGETIKASSKLYTFCKAYRSLDIQFENISQELVELDNGIRRIEATVQVAVDDVSFQKQLANFGIFLTDCRKCLEGWINRIEDLDLENLKGKKALVKKLKIVADREYFPAIRREIHDLRTRLNTSLDLFNLGINLQSITHIQLVSRNIESLRKHEEHFLDRISNGLEEVKDEIKASSIGQENTLQLVLSTAQQNDAGLKTTNESLEAIEDRLKKMQLDLELSLKLPKRQAARRKKRYPRQPLQLDHAKPAKSDVMVDRLPTTKPSTEIFRIIKLGLLLHDNRGHLEKKLLALEDSVYLKADRQQQMLIVEQVKGMRLIAWLLRQQNFLSRIHTRSERIESSSLIRNANLGDREYLDDHDHDSISPVIVLDDVFSKFVRMTKRKSMREWEKEFFGRSTSDVWCPQALSLLTIVDIRFGTLRWWANYLNMRREEAHGTKRMWIRSCGRWIRAKSAVEKKLSTINSCRITTIILGLE